MYVVRFLHCSGEVLQAGLQKKKVSFQTFMGSSLPVAVGIKPVIALAALQQSKALVAVPKSSAILLQWLVSLVNGT